MKYGGNTSCIQIDIEGSDELVVADCGTGFRNLGNKLNDHGKPLTGRIFVTHPHWDHLQGFPFFKPFYNEKNSFQIYMPPQDGVGCKEILQGHLSSTFFPVSIDMLEAELDCVTFERGQANFEHFSVEYMWAKHTVPTALFKFTIDNKVIVFAPDNELPLSQEFDNEAFVSQFRAYVQEADLLIHDAQFSREEHKHRLGWGHSDWETVIELTKDLGIKHLVLTHHDPDNDDKYLKKLEQKIKAEHSIHYESLSLAKEFNKIKLDQK